MLVMHRGGGVWARILAVHPYLDGSAELQVLLLHPKGDYDLKPRFWATYHVDTAEDVGMPPIGSTVFHGLRRRRKATVLDYGWRTTVDVLTCGARRNDVSIYALRRER